MNKIQKVKEILSDVDYPQGKTHEVDSIVLEIFDRLEKLESVIVSEEYVESDNRSYLTLCREAGYDD